MLPAAGSGSYMEFPKMLPAAGRREGSVGEGGEGKSQRSVHLNTSFPVSGS